MTHSTPNARAQILDAAAKHAKSRPVIMSHVGVNTLANHDMNPTAEEIRRIADTGGVIGLIAMPWWLSKPLKSSCAETIRRSIDHLIQHGGNEVVAFGSDFDGFTTVPNDWRSPKDYPVLRRQLESSFSSDQLDRFFSGNADRVLQAGWGN